MVNDVPNAFHVPKKQWKKWGRGEQLLFNRMFDTMTMNPDLFQHPSAEIGPKQWETTAWNAAWIAADALGEILN